MTEPYLHGSHAAQPPPPSPDNDQGSNASLGQLLSEVTSDLSTLMWGLAELVGLGWSSVIVAVIWGIIAAVLALRGKKEMKSIKGMPQTAETAKEIPPTLKPGEHTP